MFIYRSVKKSVKDFFKESFDGLFENLVQEGAKVRQLCKQLVWNHTYLEHND